MLIKYRGRDPQGTFRMGQTRLPDMDDTFTVWLGERADWPSLVVADASVTDWSAVVWSKDA